VRISVLLDGVPATSSRGFAGIASAVLLTGACGNILFDTAAINDREGLIEQLATHSLRPSDIDVVVLSHLHFDHAGNVELFPDARLMVHTDELAFARQGSPGYSGALTQVVSGHPRLELLTGPETMLDAGIELVHVPGHTPGSVALVTHVDGTRVVLAGDALKNRDEMRSADPAPPCNDPARWRVSAHRILSHDGTVVPGHDVTISVTGPRIAPSRAGRCPWRAAPYIGDLDALDMTAAGFGRPEGSS
jgi:N-acyl homoserine lactone hydrolase